MAMVVIARIRAQSGRVVVWQREGAGMSVEYLAARAAREGLFTEAVAVGIYEGCLALPPLVVLAALALAGRTHGH